MRLISVASALLVLLLPQACAAIWPFKQKRFTAEAFINAGPLGLSDVMGRVVSVGDWDGDQKLDLITLSQDRKSLTIHLWDHNAFQFKALHSLTTSSHISNVIASDFNHDGHLDLLVMFEDTSGGWWSGTTTRTEMKVYLGAGTGELPAETWDLSEATDSQPILFDADGTLKPSMLGWQPDSNAGMSALKAWLNDGNSMKPSTAPMQSPGNMCQLASPHSSAFIDIDGDCLPDLVLHCERPDIEDKYIQIWLNKGSEGYELAGSYNLPSGSGPLTFADMNRDGTMDIIFPTCSRYSTGTGICTGASINIAYNMQIPICSTMGSQRQSDAEDSKLKCRGWGELCISDPDFKFSFTQGDPSFATIPFSAIWPHDTPDLLLNVPAQESVVLPLRPGDFNVDGYPDLLFTISNSSASPHGGVFGTGDGTQARVLENVPCGKGVAGCHSGKQGRGLKAGSGKGWEALDELWDVQGASWMDIDDDGSLDILLQRSGDQDKERVTFIQNNFYHDAFFLKAQVLNGACDQDCVPSAGGKKYSSLGVGYSGATYKFTVLDTMGHRVAQQAAQMPQTNYHALGTPYSFIGLGRTNNYVERLHVGASLYPPFHTTFLESLVPNSQIIINPPASPNDTLPNSNDPNIGPVSPVKTRSKQWRSELYLHPGDWVPWVGAAVVGTVVILGFVVMGLNTKEKREDERERRQALHAINFQAL